MTLYIPEKFRAGDWQKVVQEFPLATLLAGETISHLPLYLEGETLVGHLARANPQAALLDRANCTAVFHGPAAYVSPTWYEQCDVPTWNYVVVHIKGRAKLLSEKETVRALMKISERMEGADGWKFEIPEDLRGGELHRAIAGFEIQVESVETKSKLSQNRSSRDRQGVIDGLRNRGDARSQELATWMEACNAQHSSEKP